MIAKLGKGRGKMRRTTTAAVTVIVAMAISIPAFAQRSDRRAAQVRPTYEQCYQLGLARGFIVSVGDWRNFEWFIRQCMDGKIPF